MTIKSRENHVSKNTEAVLDFTYLIAEIGYDQIDHHRRPGIRTTRSTCGRSR
jgi:hypothetical protein